MPTNWKENLYTIIFKSDTPKGKLFDIVLLWVIVLSVLIVMLESIPQLDKLYDDYFHAVEWLITIIFTVEYVLRIIIIENKRKYIFSFFGIIDLLSILPTYLGIFLVGAQHLMIIRALRLLRMFRILKLTRYIREASRILIALRRSRQKISVFILAILTIVSVIGTLMYLIEGAESGFTSIPRSIYWAIVTLTTVGYGDIAPSTDLGQFVASIVMIMGYAIIAVPTGIVTVELTRIEEQAAKRNCNHCEAIIQDPDAYYCKYCGTKLKSKT